MSEVFPIGFERRSMPGQVWHLVVFDAARFRDGEHCINLVHAIWNLGGPGVIEDPYSLPFRNMSNLISKLQSGQKWDLLWLQQQFSAMTPSVQVDIQNADVLSPDDLWAFVFFLAGFSSGKIWFVLSPKDETIAALKASTQAQRSPRLLAVMMHKLGITDNAVGAPDA